MPLVGALVLLIQLSFAYHALKTRRPYWWIFIIMGFPAMGCVLYYFIEVFPSSRESRSAQKAARAIARAFDPTRTCARASPTSKPAAASRTACCSPASAWTKACTPRRLLSTAAA
jgi:hypothetical protein